MVMSADEVEAALFPVRWWQFFTIGLASMVGIVMTIRRGRKECEIAPVMDIMSKEHVENLIKIGVLESEARIAEKLKQDLIRLRAGIVKDLKIIIGNSHEQ